MTAYRRDFTQNATWFFTVHVDYIHWNPLKHGLCQRVADWPHPSFHRYVAQGIYPMDWCGGHDVICKVPNKRE